MEMAKLFKRYYILSSPLYFPVSSRQVVRNFERSFVEGDVEV